MNSARLFYLTPIALAVAACGGSGGGSSTPPPTTTPPPDPAAALCTTQVDNSGGGGFRQTSLALGLCYELNETFAVQEIQVMGGGLAMSDVDKDGDLDLWVSHGMHDKGRLYLNDGASFSLAAGNNGISLSAIDNAGYFIDIDSDGWDDFVSIQYVANVVEIFLNDQTGQFAEATSTTNIYLSRPTYSLASADVDLDGDLDLFFSHWGAAWDAIPDPLREYLWVNDGTGAYTDASANIEIVPTYNPPPYDDLLVEHSFTPIFTDLNNDLYPDLLLAGDFEASQVLLNNTDLSFSDITSSEISDENGMGAAIADYDRDGDFDWFVSSIFYSGKEPKHQGGVTGNRLYRNDGNGTFTDVTDEAGVRDGDWGWGSCFADFDNDGHADIFHTNGMRSSMSREGDETDPLFPFFRDESRLFMSQGDGTFLEQAEAMGINHDGQGRGVLCTDYDQDGKIDILVANSGDSPTVYRNEISNANHYLQIDLVGSTGNLKGIGAVVTVTTASGSQVQQVQSGTNYLSHQPATLHFGLGSDAAVTSLQVRWPDNSATTTTIMDVAVDQRLEVSKN